MTEDEIKQAQNAKKQLALRHAYRRLFQSDDGDVVKKDLESFCGQMKSSVSEHSPDAYQTMFCEGKRRVYLRILSMLRIKEDENEKL